MDIRLSLLVVYYVLSQLRCTYSVRFVVRVRFTYRTWLFVTDFIVHSISSTRLPAILRSRVQTLPLATYKASPTWLWTQWPFTPACPASSNYTQTLRWASCAAVQFVYAFMPALYSLGQSVLLQGCVSMALPVHPLPPFFGGGLLQRRTRVTLPSPHVVVHADQGDHRPQFPSEWTKQ